MVGEKKRNRRPFAIVLDYDDTIVEFTSFLCTLHNKLNNTCITKSDVKEWHFNSINMSDVRGNTVTGEDFTKTYKTYEKNGLYAALPAMRDAVHAIKLMRKMGYKVVILTARDPIFEKDTELNAIHQGIEYDEIVFNIDKVSAIRSLKKKYNIKMFADDKESTVLKVAEKCNIEHIFLVDETLSKEIDDNEDIIPVRDIMDSIRYLKDKSHIT